LIELWLQHLTKGRIEDGLGEGSDMLWYAFADEKCGEVIREVVTVVKE
jgi:alkanesulfonate monooxygenase SsuD/methylene tetrahydromethanopterin reductase-like flavin-dependent oxidoreductase (luciferase family)